MDQYVWLCTVLPWNLKDFHHCSLEQEEQKILPLFTVTLKLTVNTITIYGHYCVLFAHQAEKWTIKWAVSAILHLKRRLRRTADYTEQATYIKCTLESLGRSISSTRVTLVAAQGRAAWHCWGSAAMAASVFVYHVTKRDLYGCGGGRRDWSQH